MKEYIEKILHQNVQVIPYEEKQKLPLIFQSAYSLNRMIIGSQEVLLAAPIERPSLVNLRKHHKQMEVCTGLPCVLYLRNMNYYTRDAMLEEGIAFVWEGHQIYLPFIGVLLDDHPRQVVPACTKISFLTQKLLLLAMYQGWQQITVTKASEVLGVTKTSVTRCFDELEALNLPYLTIKSRARNFNADTDKKAMWETIRPILRDPVIKTYMVKEKPVIPLPLSGISALSYYSMLDDGAYPVYAVTKKDLPNLDFSAANRMPAGEIPACVIQETGYHIAFQDNKVIDPLTVALILAEEALVDPRVSMAVDQMLEKYVW